MKKIYIIFVTIIIILIITSCDEAPETIDETLLNTEDTANISIDETLQNTKDTTTLINELYDDEIDVVIKDDLFDNCTAEIYNFVYYVSKIADNIEYEYFSPELMQNMINNIKSDNQLLSGMGGNAYIETLEHELELIKEGKKSIYEMTFDILDENGNSVMIDSGNKKLLSVPGPSNFYIYNRYNYNNMKASELNQLNDLTGYNYEPSIKQYEDMGYSIEIYYYTYEEYNNYIDIYKRNIDIKVKEGYPRRLIEKTIFAMENELELIKNGKQLISAVFASIINNGIKSTIQLKPGGIVFVSDEKVS